MAAGGSVTRSLLTTATADSELPLVTTKSAEDPSTPQGGRNGYTISVQNRSDNEVTVDSISDPLPEGFTYVPGSTSGATSSDPSQSGRRLTFEGPFTVPANGEIRVSFGVVVSEQTGTYENSASAEAGNTFVLGTGPTAQITVTPRPSQCSDGEDNDSDQKTDFPADPGGASAADDDESDPPPPPPATNNCTSAAPRATTSSAAPPAVTSICAGSGNDVVYGRGGNDTIYGGSGNDIVYGAAGDDTIRGGEGNDVLRGGDGDDRLRGGPGRDVLYGNEGRDFLDTRDNRGGNDVARGGPGDDDCETDRGDVRSSC